MKNRQLFLVLGLCLVFVATASNLQSQSIAKTLQPDLIVRFTAPTTAFAGQDIGSKIKMTVTNRGRGLAFGTLKHNSNGYMVDLVLSKDTKTPDGWAIVSTTFKEDALLVGGRTSRTDDLPGGKSKSYNIGAKIPADTPPGTYYLVMNVDPGKKVAELNEKNNKYWRKIRIMKLITPNLCAKRYPNPRITFDKQDAQGRVYIPVVNAAAYDNVLFKPAPNLPPCGANKNSSRTWVDIYDGKTNKRMYGFCALGSNADLKDIWFHSNAKSGWVYIIINDRLCKRKYRSNTLHWGVVSPCAKRYPNPVIYYKKRDAQGRVYIPVKNWNAYSNSMFAAAPNLPPCGNNTKSSRTWVDIYDARTNARIYGFCAFNSANDLQTIWFGSKMRSGRVYIIIHDRLCKRKYRSNILSWPK